VIVECLAEKSRQEEEVPALLTRRFLLERLERSLDLAFLDQVVRQGFGLAPAGVGG